jgi:hypothetical protein
MVRLNDCFHLKIIRWQHSSICFSVRCGECARRVRRVWPAIAALIKMRVWRYKAFNSLHIRSALFRRLPGNERLEEI